MDRLDKSYITLLDSDQWKILVSDSVSTVMRWSKRTKWCTKDRETAADYLGEGDCIAFIDDDMRKPRYLMFAHESGIWNRSNDQIKLINFFEREPELLNPV